MARCECERVESSPEARSAAWVAGGRRVSDGRRPFTRPRDRASSHMRAISNPWLGPDETSGEGWRFKPPFAIGRSRAKVGRLRLGRLGLPKAMTRRPCLAPLDDSDVPKGFAKNGDAIGILRGFFREGQGCPLLHFCLSLRRTRRFSGVHCQP